MRCSGTFSSLSAAGVSLYKGMRVSRTVKGVPSSSGRGPRGWRERKMGRGSNISRAGEGYIHIKLRTQSTRLDLIHPERRTLVATRHRTGNVDCKHRWLSAAPG